MTKNELQQYAPRFEPEQWSERDRRYLTPFFTNPDGNISAIRNLPPELVGALCSRASRAPGSLLRVFLRDYVYSIVDGEDKEMAAAFEEWVAFHETHDQSKFAEKGRRFFVKWLAQFGDDSIAQMTGINLIFSSISQVAMKFVEDQRIGLEPIEKSTRYVDFGQKPYQYYFPEAELKSVGLADEYRAAMDNLFDTYVELREPLVEWFKKTFDSEPGVMEKKAFDTLRGLLPMATLSQVAIRGNGAAWEYLINRTADQHPYELRWIAAASREELEKEIPSLLMRINDEKTAAYQRHLGSRKERIRATVERLGWSAEVEASDKPKVLLVDFDPEGENKVIAHILKKETDLSLNTVLERVRRFSTEEKRAVLGEYMGGRTARWQKVGRAFEFARAHYEIEMNIGAYRDLHRHRMLTQDRQYFTARLGYDVPREIVEAGLGDKYSAALERIKPLYEKLRTALGKDLAQYVVPLSYRIRFEQDMAIREAFWESELRTSPQGHPDYRTIEQEKFRQFKEKYPLIAEHMLVDMNDYAFARRESEKDIARKEERFAERFGK